nr:porin [uncultured Roseateles sp.]
MKNTTILSQALALALLGGALDAAQAQSVTLFGRLDAGVAKQSGDVLGSTAWQLQDGAGSLFGIRGSEDLGGGLSVSFDLQHWLDSSSGSTLNPDPQPPGGGLKFWGRRAVVSLKGSFGQVTLGRDLSPVFVQGVLVDPFTFDRAACLCGGAVALSKDRSSGKPYVAAGSVANVGAARYDNAIIYAAPAMGDIRVSAMVALNENQVLGGKRSYGLAFDYGAHFGAPLALSLGFEQNGTIATAGGAGKYWIAAGGYRFDAYRLTAAYSSGKLDANGDRTRNLLLGGEIALGASTLLASFDHFTNRGVANWESNKLTVGYHYSFSKRTMLYADASNVRAKGQGSGARVNAFDTGISHDF